MFAFVSNDFKLFTLVAVLIDVMIDFCLLCTALGIECFPCEGTNLT